MRHFSFLRLLSISICVGMLSAVVLSHSSFADPGKMEDKPAPIKKEPPKIGTIEGKTDTVPTPELSIDAVVHRRPIRRDSPLPLPGEEFELTVTVSNLSYRPIRFTVAHLGPGSNLVLGIRDVELRSRQVYPFTYRIPLDKERIRGNHYAGSIVLAKWNAGARERMLDQLWKDGNQDDNAKNLTVPVDIRKYTVEAEFLRVFVTDDCDSGDQRGEWKANFELLKSGRAMTGTGDLTNRTHIKAKDSIQIWGTPSGDTSDIMSRQTYRYTDRQVRLEQVHWNAHLTLVMHASEDDSPLASGCWHKPFESLSPERWLARRGEWVEFPMRSNIRNLRPTVRIRVRPEG